MIPAFVNPHSGNAAAAADAIAADPRFALQVLPPDRLLAGIRAQIGQGAPRVLVGGGDGTLASAAGLLVPAAVELAIVPAGTLNHFARSVGLTGDLRQALEIAAGSTSRTVDVGSVNGRLFLNTSVVGAYVAMVELRDQLQPRLGYHLSGILSALALLVRHPHLSLELQVEHARRRYRTPLVFIGVGEREFRFPNFGERTASDRPVLHTIVVRGSGRTRVLALALATLINGLHRTARTPHLDAFFVEHLELDIPGHEVHLALDGEIHRMHAPLEYSLLPHALRVAAVPPA